jgi:hypothetical protein
MYNLTFTKIKPQTKKPELFTWTFIEGRQYTNVPSELFSQQLQRNYTPASTMEDLNLMYVTHGLVKVVKSYQNA